VTHYDQGHHLVDNSFVVHGLTGSLVRLDQYREDVGRSTIAFAPLCADVEDPLWQGSEPNRQLQIAYRVFA
jgi:hypothetical protein